MERTLLLMLLCLSFISTLHYDILQICASASLGEANDVLMNDGASS